MGIFLDDIMKSLNENGRPRDWKHFNCKEEHEDCYVSKLYGGNKDKVHDFLVEKCEDGTINYSTHDEVYDLIEEELGIKKV